MLSEGASGARYEVRRFYLAGICIRLETNSLSFARAICRQMAEAPGPIRGGADEVQLSVVVRPGVSSGREPFFRGWGHIVMARFGEDVFVFDLRRRKVTAVVSESTARDMLLWRSTLLPVAVGLLGPCVGVVPFHCACVITDSGGILIAGLSGAGKSTLSVAVAKMGCRLVSDDWTYVRAEKDRLVAYGLQVPVKLLPDSARFFPELSSQQPTSSLNGELAYVIDPAARLGVPTHSTCVPETIFFLERMENGDSQIQPVQPELVLSHFQRSCERLSPELAFIAYRRLAVMQAVSKLPAFSFRYAGTPAEGARSLLSVLKHVEKAA